MSGFAVQPGDVLAGKYRVESVLGEGGMGVVVAAWHTELEQHVAMKFLRREIADRGDIAERFRREARAAVRIHSEHVARVLDVGTMDEGVPYMVMEYLDGQDLSDELSQRGTLPIAEAVDYLLQATEAVAEAHAAGIVHRDLKPANLFLTHRADGTPLVKVLDFGISKSISGSSVGEMSLTHTAAMMGSPLYMSPEQMQSSKSVDARTDVWALGVILYQMLAGRTPYEGETVPELCAAVFTETAKPISAFRSDVPPELEQALARCLERDRERRWTNVAELAQAIAPFGPAEARIHANRAQRVLGGPDATHSGTSAVAEVDGTGPGATAGGSTAGGSTTGGSTAGGSTAGGSTTGGSTAGGTGPGATIPAGGPPVVGSGPGATVPAGGSTVDAWGRTELTAAPVVPASKSPRWLIPVGALVLVLAGVGVALLVHSPSATADSAAAQASASAEKLAPPTAAGQPTARSASAPTASASAATSAAAPPSASTPASSAAPAPPSPRKRVAPRAHPRRRPVHEKPDNGVIPAFGGRR